MRKCFKRPVRTAGVPYGPYEYHSDLGDTAVGTVIELLFKNRDVVAKTSPFLSSFDFKFLLFSRNLKVVSISDRSKSRQVNISGLFAQYPANQNKHMSQIEVVTNVQRRSWHFCTFDSRVIDMPADTWRSGKDSSVIRLAFPYEDIRREPELSKRGTPLLASCKTFAFLPIRDFGFTVRSRKLDSTQLLKFRSLPYTVISFCQLLVTRSNPTVCGIES